MDGVYVCALVEYSVDKSESILKIFREKEIKDAFWNAYSNQNPQDFLKKVKDFLKGNSLDHKIKEAKIDLRAEIEEFGETFIQVAKRTKDTKFTPYPRWDLEVYPVEFKALIKDKTKIFCGRIFVFEAFEKFIRENKKT